MGCINNSISCLEKKTTLGTHDQTCYVILIGVHPSYATLVVLVLFYEDFRFSAQNTQIITVDDETWYVWVKITKIPSK